MSGPGLHFDVIFVAIMKFPDDLSLAPYRPV